MKLHELKKGSIIKCEVSDGSEFVTFDHVDGMYSVCISEKANSVQLSANTPLRKVAEHYEIYDPTPDH